MPTIHRILLNRASKEFQSASRRALRFIRSCSAPLDEELAASVAATFGAPVISAYGMTEASHQLASNPLPVDGTNRPSSVGLPTNVEIRLIGEDDTDAPPGNVAEIWIKGATVEVPKRIYVVNDLPRTAKGSIDRHALAAHFANPRWAVVANVGRES